MVPDLIKIREPVLVIEEKNKYSLHEFPKFDWLTMIALPVGDNDWLNALYITEISPYCLGNFRKFILNIIFELSSEYLQKYFIHLKTYIN